MGTQHSGDIDIYARVSRASDDRQRSVKGQVDDCAARLSEAGHSPGQTHVDNSRSAWNPQVRRPGWDALMSRLESGATGGVIVFDLARFSRRPIEGERLIQAAENGLLVLDSENSYDLTSANGKKHFRDQLATAAYESDRLSTRVKRGKKAKATRGEPNVSARPFGFEPDGITHRGDEARVLRDLVTRFLAGESQDALIADLNNRGITTSYGKAWTRAGLRQVLTRERNAGLITHQGIVVGRLPGEAVISEDEHERVIAVYTSRRNGRPSSLMYLCSGIATCALCGHRLTGRPRTNMKPYPDGGTRRQYWCQPREPKGGCQRIAIDQRGLDKHIRELTAAILSDARHASAIEAAARAAADTARDIDASIADIEHLTRELAARLGRGEITLDRYDAATAPLDRRLDELRSRRAALPETPEIDAAGSREEWLGRWDAATVEERRTLVRMALRGRRLLIAPAERGDRGNVARRVVLE